MHEPNREHFETQLRVCADRSDAAQAGIAKGGHSYNYHTDDTWLDDPLLRFIDGYDNVESLGASTLGMNYARTEEFPSIKTGKNGRPGPKQPVRLTGGGLVPIQPGAQSNTAIAEYIVDPDHQGFNLALFRDDLLDAFKCPHRGCK
jgi:hypothetical protein